MRKAKLREIKEAFSNYLQKRNYPSMKIPKNSFSATEFMVSCLIDNSISRSNSILYSCFNSDPIAIDCTFTSVVSWVEELTRTKCEYKDLEKLLGPLYCHFYFEILRGDHTEQADTFLKQHKTIVDKFNYDKIVSDLINELNNENDTNSFLHLKEHFRSNKYAVQLSMDSINVLKRFLESSHVVLLHVLQNWFIIDKMLEQQVIKENEGEEKVCSSVNSLNKTKNNCRNHRKSKEAQRLLSVINNVRTDRKLLYSVSINNKMDDVTCGVLNRNNGLLAYSYNNCTAVRHLGALQTFPLFLDLNEVVLLGHSARVYDLIMFSNYLISCSQDKTIRLYDLNDCLEKIVYYGHEYPVYCLCASRNNEYFVSGSYDRMIQLWSVTHKNSLRYFIGHSEEVTSVNIHPNSVYVASGSADKTIKMWSISNAELVRSFAGSTGTIYSVRFTTDGKYLLSTGEDGMLRVWDLQAGKLLTTIRNGSECCNKIAVSHDETHITIGSVDGTVKIWNLKKIIEELSIDEPVCSYALRPKVLDLDYYNESFGCLRVA